MVPLPWQAVRPLSVTNHACCIRSNFKTLPRGHRSYLNVTSGDSSIRELKSAVEGYSLEIFVGVVDDNDIGPLLITWVEGTYANEVGSHSGTSTHAKACKPYHQ